MASTRKTPARRPPPRHSQLHWHLSKERILLTAGLLLITAEFIVTEFLNRPYHIEYLLGGLALCGTSITGWVQKGEEQK